jgi:hypothetical protein
VPPCFCRGLIEAVRGDDAAFVLKDEYCCIERDAVLFLVQPILGRVPFKTDHVYTHRKYRQALKSTKDRADEDGMAAL